MSKTRSPYAPEFRQRMVELSRAGRPPEELAREFEPSAQTISNWVTQADRDEGRRGDGLTAPSARSSAGSGVRTADCAKSAISWHKVRRVR